MLLFLKLLVLLISGIFIFLMFSFTIYSWLNRKTLRLGFAERPATALDMFIISIMPFCCIYIGYSLYIMM